MVSLSDWLTEYPAISDPNIAGRLAEMTEFNMYSGKAVEPEPKPGEPYPHQKLFQRAYDVYNEVLVMDDPGTGKSCLIAALTEFLKRQYEYTVDKKPSLLRPPIYSGAVLLGRGEIIERNFKYELVCRCTRNVYELPDLTYKSALSRQSQITKLINKYYTIDTYYKFAKDIENYSDEQLIEKYNGSVFIIDEAHNIVPKELSPNSVMMKEKREKKEKGEKKEKDKEMVYRVLHRLFHVLPRRKVILLTATPFRMYAVEEFSALINLIRPLESQMPPGPENMPLEEFADWLSGYTVYARTLDTGVDFIFQGVPLGDLIGDNYTTVVQPVEMSAFQSAYYAQAQQTYGAREFYLQVRQAANMVFPDGSYGNEGFEKYIINDNHAIWRFTDQMLAAMNTARVEYPENPLYKFSAKFAYLAGLMYQYYPQGKKGYIYEEHKTGSGIIAMGLLFEQVGIDRYYRHTSAFATGTNENTIGTFCPAQGNISGNRQVLIDKRLRYALLVPENPVEVTRSIMELYNSPENSDGSYILCLGFSPVGREGISLQGVQWMAENPGWHWPGTKQSIYRGRRTTSHIEMLRQKRVIDPNARIDLDVYLLAAIPAPEYQATSVDTRMYQESEAVARVNSPYSEMAKSVALDCWLERKRNVRPGDVALNGTALCDFGNCIYDCRSEPPREIQDNSGLLRKYASDYQQTIRKYLRTISAQTVTIPLQVVINYLTEQGIPSPVVYLELAHAQASHEPYINRYGQTVYAHFSNGYVVYTTQYPGRTITDDTQIKQVRYMQEYPTVRNLSIVEYLDITTSQTAIVGASQYLTYSAEDVIRILPSLDIKERGRLFEISLHTYLTTPDTTTPAMVAIINHYQPKYYAFYEPQTQIHERYTRAVRSRRVNQPSLPPPVTITATVPVVYVHSIYGLGTGEGGSYPIPTVSLKPAEIRIYQNGTWRKANWVELEVYQEQIRDAILLRERPLAQARGIYAYMLLDDPEREIRLTDGEEKEDMRFRLRGQVCNTMTIPKLAPLVYELGLNLPVNNNLTPTEINNIILTKKVTLRTTDPQEPTFVANLINSHPYSIRTICSELRNYLLEQELVAVR